MTLGLLQMVAVAEAENTILIAECNKDRNTCAPSVAFRMTFGLSLTAIAAVVENMRCCNKDLRMDKLKNALLNAFKSGDKLK